MSTENRSKVLVGDLKIGMFVCDLDRPWSETTFPLQGFYINNEQDKLKIEKQCDFVYINNTLSKKDDAPSKSVAERKKIIQSSWSKKLRDYKDTTSWELEFPKAKTAINELSLSMQQVFESFQKTQSLDVQKIKKSVEPMIESIGRNPDACIWLARMKREDNYTYEHSISASIWSVALGRQIGLGMSDQKSLALGALLFDIGKLSVNQKVLNAPRKLSQEEYTEVQSHVEHSLNMISKVSGLNKDVIAMIAQHHERHSGKGYPNGLKGDEIHIFARIAAIADCYDAITSNRAYAEAIPPSEAIKMLYKLRDVEFQAELVEEFIQAIGIYPAGSLVRLSTGEVAIVLAEYRTRRLRPEVLVLMDRDKTPLKKSFIIKMHEQEYDKDGKRIDIVESLEPKAFGIDMKSIRL